MSTEALKSLQSDDCVAHFINGQHVADSGRSQDVFNPATGEVVRQVALANRKGSGSFNNCPAIASVARSFTSGNC